MPSIRRRRIATCEVIGLFVIGVGVCAAILQSPTDNRRQPIKSGCRHDQSTRGPVSVEMTLADFDPTTQLLDVDVTVEPSGELLDQQGLLRDDLTVTLHPGKGNPGRFAKGTEAGTVTAQLVVEIRNGDVETNLLTSDGVIARISLSCPHP